MIVVTGTWRGVGSTTSAVLLAAAAAAEGVDGWMVEADPAGGVLAGRAPELSGRAASLVSLAFNDPVDGPTEAAGFAHRLGDVGVFTQSIDPFEAAATVGQPRFSWVDHVLGLPGLVVVDVGSLRGANPAANVLLRRADAVLIVTSPDPSMLVPTADWVNSGARSSPEVAAVDTRRWSLLVVESPAVGREVCAPSVHLPVPVSGWWPWDPATVDGVMRGADVRFRRRGRLAAAAARTLSSVGGVLV